MNKAEAAATAEIMELYILLSLESVRSGAGILPLFAERTTNVARGDRAMAENVVSNDIERMLRLQRHDFINHIQVIQALLQLGKFDRALGYIEEMVKSPEMTGNLLEIYQQRQDCRKAD